MFNRHSLFLFIVFLTLTCNVRPCMAGSNVTAPRLFQRLGVDQLNLLEGNAFMLKEKLKKMPNEMVIHLNLNLLRGEYGYAPNMLLDIFGKSIQVNRRRVTKRGPSDYTWFGKIDGDPSSNVFLTVGGQVMFGRIEYSGSLYSIEPIGDGLFHRIIKLDTTKIMQFDNDILIPPEKVEPSNGVTKNSQNYQITQNTLLEPPVAALDNGSVIDIMILYTDGMAAAYPDNQINTKINSLVDLANQAYTNSQVDTRLNIVKTQQISYTDGGSLNTALTELINGAGVFSDVAALRDQYAADTVVLLRKYQTSNDSCGLAYVMQNVSSSFASRAFSVTQEGKTNDGFRCSDYALAHEVGHNLGSVHDRAHSTFSGAYDYSYGYDVAGVFGTIMSYEGPTIGYFSNPGITYNGYSIGIAEGQPDSADNAQSIRNTIATVARFRESPGSDSDITPPTVTISSPCSSSCTVSSPTITVSGSAGDSGGSGLNRINIKSGADEWNLYNVSGDSDVFSVSGVSLSQSQNTISAQSYDNAGNFSDLYTIYVTYSPPCSDNDNDGYSPEGETCGLVDCDDNDPDRSPGNSEICYDAKDNDCDGLIDSLDNDCDTVKYYCDKDNDGHIDEFVTGTCLGSGCQPGGCLTNPGTDCNDSDLSVNPEAVEGLGDDSSCSDTKDNDCDGATDSDDTGCEYLFIPDITITDQTAPIDDLEISFGSLLNWSSSEQVVSIRNDGTGDLAIGNIAQSNPLEDPFSIQIDNCSEEVLEASYGCDLTIRFSPSEPGTFNDSFDISSNDPDENPVTVSLEGTAFLETSNKQPTPFQLLYPANKQTGLGTTVIFRWTASSDPEGSDVTYSLYYCNETDPEKCDPVEVLAAAGIHRLPAYDYADMLFLGVVFVIGAGISRKRRLVMLLAGLFILSGIILVSCGDEPKKETPANNGIYNNRTGGDEVSYTMSGLNTGARYYWMVTASDGDGEKTKSDIWSFSTK